MKKSMTLAAAAVAFAAVLCAVGTLSDGSDASYASTFGSDSVGAEKMIFDSNGGSGGYAQYVLNGNSVYFPTEYKAPGTSNSAYPQISRDGYVLMGWAESSSASSPSYYPGQSYTVTADRTFYAVWKDLTYDCIGRFGGSGSDMDSEAQHVTVRTGSGPGLTANDNTGAYILMKESINRTSIRYILTVTCNGDPVSSTATQTNTSVSADWLTLGISNSGSFSFSGTPSRTGVYEITVEMQTKGFSGSWGDLEDLWCRWYVSAYDDDDPSNILHVTYGGTGRGYGPYHTAVKLPDSVSQRQKGWNVTVDGSPAVFPVGGSYSLVRKETVLTASEYTFDEVNASGVAGVIAYNANGGYYNGPLAELVPADGYAGLKNGSVVSKEGAAFIGWNPSGSPSDVIYPAGYLYNMSGGYTELKAVWGTPGTAVKIYFENPGNGAQNTSYDERPGFRYALPVNGFSLTGFDFLGWSETKHDVGTGTADVNGSAVVSGTKTYYAVFKANTYTCTIRYDANGGTGTMADQTATVSTVPHYMTVAGSSFAYEGYTFAGWAETRYAESPSYLPGSSYAFAGSGEVTLYAVWSEDPVPPAPSVNTFNLIFNGNGPSVTNVPPRTYRNTPEAQTAFHVPSSVPQRADYNFLGWSETSYGPAVYQPGQGITLTLPEGSTTCTVVLYAVWEPKNTGGGGTDVTVTFSGDSGVLRTVTVQSGGTVAQIAAPAVEGRAFDGWYNLDKKWDFSAPVTGDMTLTAKYVPVFHLDADGASVRVVLDCVSSSTKVSFSDGFSGTYTTSSIPAHTVAEGTEGTVTVSVVTEKGPYTAVCHWKAPVQGGGSGGEDGGEDDEEDSGSSPLSDKNVWFAVCGILGLAAVIAVARRFL